jgi:type I restriction enzyme S subunit
VPQDPNDEPASVMLERIRDEIAAVKEKPSRPKKTRRKKKSPRKATAK